MIFFIVPVYNEAENAGGLVEGLSAASASAGEPFRIIAVDDGSTDGSAEALEALDAAVEVIRFGANRGIASVLREGFARACGLADDDDPLVFIEADCSNDPGTLSSMLERFRGGADVVSASRYVKGGKIRGFPPARRAVSRLSNLVLRLLVPLPAASDYTYFFKMYRARTVKEAFREYGDAFLKTRRFSANAEFFIKMRRLTSRYDQVPTRYDYARKGSESKFAPIREVPEYVRLIAVCRAELRRSRHAAGL
ncbi:MAG: glycosyltransferase [bacterium]